MKIPHRPSLPSTIKACGFTVVANFVAAGCVPNWAESLTTEETREFRDQLDSINQHLDFAQDITARANPGLLFVDDKDVVSPTSDDVRAQQEESLEGGYELLDEGRIYMYRGETFPELAIEDGAAYTHISFKPYIVFLEGYLDAANLMHELTHVVTRQGHSDEITEAPTDFYPPVSMIVRDKDDAYRDSIVFQTILTIETIIHERYLEETVLLYSDSDRASFAGDYDLFKSTYSNFSEHIDLIQNHSDEWATKFVGLSFYGEEYDKVGEWILYSPNNLTTITGLWNEMDLTRADIVEICTLPSTQYLRDDAIQTINDAQQLLREANPEYYAQYQNELSKETKIKTPELRQPLSRSHFR